MEDKKLGIRNREVSRQGGVKLKNRNSPRPGGAEIEKLEMKIKQISRHSGTPPEAGFRIS